MPAIPSSGNGPRTTCAGQGDRQPAIIHHMNGATTMDISHLMPVEGRLVLELKGGPYDKLEIRFDDEATPKTIVLGNHVYELVEPTMYYCEPDEETGFYRPATPWEIENNLIIPGLESPEVYRYQGRQAGPCDFYGYTEEEPPPCEP